MANGVRKNGEFCWINIVTPDIPAAREFFTGLFGWTHTDLPDMGGGIMKVDGSDIGGMWDMGSPNMPPDTRPAVGVMFKVDSADAAAEKVRSLGGQAQPPMDVMTNGRMVACTDPNGALFDLWEAKDQPGMTADSFSHGVPSWPENLSTDVERSREFYTGLFGWTSNEQDMGHMRYTIFNLGDDYAAGMMQYVSEMGDMPKGWSAYMTVTDVDASVVKAGDLGAQVFMPAMDVPNTGRMAGLISPQGVPFYVITYFAS